MVRSGQRLSWEIVASLWLHLSAASALVLFERCAPSSHEPLFKPNEVMQIQMAAAPMPYAARTQRAERAPDPVTTPAPAPEPVTEPAAPPPAASDMVLQQEKDEPDPVDTPEPEPEDPKNPPPAEPQDNSLDRAALLNQARREELVNPNAPLGQQDRTEASPDGQRGVTSSVIGIGEADPILAAYIQACRDAILPNWTPLPSTLAAHPEYAVVLQVTVAADGRLGTPQIVQGSGDTSFDRTAEMAVLKTQRLPPPPPEWAASAANGVQIRLAAKDK